MSGSGTQCSMVKTTATETGGRGEVLRNRNVGTRTRIISSSIARTRSRTPAKDCSRGTIRSKIGSARSPTPKKSGVCSKKSDRISAVKQRQGDTRPRITRLAYSKNPIMNPIFSRLSKLDLDRIHSASSHSSRTLHKKENDSASVDITIPKSTEDVESREEIEETDSPQMDEKSSTTSSQGVKPLRTRNESSQISVDHLTPKPSVEKESMTNAEELVPTATAQTNTTPNPSTPSSRDIYSPHASSRQLLERALACQGAIPRSITVHTMIPHSSSVGQPTPIIRREPSDCHSLREPKYEESVSPIMRHPALTQPSTSSYTEANVVTIPSDTYAACQAAFSYAAGTATEALDNVLVQLQVPAASEGGGVTHVSKIVVPGPSGHGMQSTLAMLHSSGSNSSVSSTASGSGSSSESTSSASESDWDGGPRIVEEDEDVGGSGNRGDPKGSRSAGLSRISLQWGESDDDEKMRQPKEE